MKQDNDLTRAVAKLRFMRDRGDISEREYLRAGALLFGEQDSPLRTIVGAVLLIVLNLLVLGWSISIAINATWQ